MKPDDIEQKVCDRLRSLYGETAAPLIADIEQRQAFGLAKYGVRLKDNPAPLAARLRHMLEELLDAPIYARWARDAYPEGSWERAVLAHMEEELLGMAMRIKNTIPDEPPTSKPVTGYEEARPVSEEELDASWKRVQRLLKDDEEVWP